MARAARVVVLAALVGALAAVVAPSAPAFPKLGPGCVRADYASGTTFSQATVWSYLGGQPHQLASFELSLDGCNMLEGERYESTLLARWDASRRSLCFLQKRRDLACPAQP